MRSFLPLLALTSFTVSPLAHLAGSAHTQATLPPTTPQPESATKDLPFANSLGMRFIPVHGTKVLFSIWETRIKDFQAFHKDTGRKPDQDPPFQQTPDDPVVMISWNDAKAFCVWLSEKEGRQYRLPTEEERRTAVGSDKYPWGETWPPRSGTENIAGEESQIGQSNDPNPNDVLKGYRDDHPRTSPVGTYKPTQLGLYDIGGNVREWLESSPKGIPGAENHRIAAGGGWARGIPSFLTSSTALFLPTDLTGDYLGFRCVLDTNPTRSIPQQSNPTESPAKQPQPAQSPDRPTIANPKDITKSVHNLCNTTFNIPYNPPTGTHVERITWSPKTKQILFSITKDTSKSPTLLTNMFSIDLANNRIAPWFIQPLIHPTFSPDGRLVAAVKLPCKVVLIDLEKKRQNDCVNEYSWWPSFLSDGRNISYMSHKPHPFTLSTQSIDGSHKTTITTLPKGDNIADASPTSREIAYLSHLHNGIAVRKLDGDKRILFQTQFSGFPKWSPDGQFIAILTRRTNIWIIDRLAKVCFCITDQATRLSDTCVWSPDGKQIVYHVHDKTHSHFQFASIDTKQLSQLIASLP